MNKKPYISDEQAHELLIGRDPRTTLKALLLSGIFFTISLILGYINLKMELDINFLKSLIIILHLHAGGIVLVIILAALHAYVNKGYLPSILLAISPSYGSFLWTIGSMDEISNIHLDFSSAWERLFPEAPLYATLGFLIGVLLRILVANVLNRRSGDTSD